MPIKLPKGFQRRKSSGNALEDVPSAESSFKVLARPGSSGAVLDTARLGQPQHSAAYTNSRPSYEDDNEDLFSVLRPGADNRGSAGTNNSHSTVQNGSAASSSRISTSSTNPSSVETRSDKHPNNASQRNQNDANSHPPSSRGGFLRNAGRTFSFGNIRRSHEVNDLPPPPPVPQKTPASSVRDRSMTVSSVTTATPPRLEDTDLSLDNSELDSFGNMFDGMGFKGSREPSPSRKNVHAASATTQLRTGPLLNARNAVPRQVLLEQDRELESSPYSFASQNSADGLMRSPSPSKTATQNYPPSNSTRSPYTAGTVLSRTESADEENIFEDTPLQQSRTKSSSVRPPPSSFPASMTRERGYSQAGSVIRSPISERSSIEVPGIDPALVANADLATRYEEKKAKAPVGSAKVMTPAQFERYKLQKEETRKYNKVFGKEESDDSGDNYEDDEEDEADRQREQKALKQRKKQEAHLAVYRQQMIKVTGDTSPKRQSPVERPGSSQSNHGPSPTGMLDIPGLGNRMSTITIDGKFSQVSNGKSSSNDEDEDEDVPLGILAAHGFPNRNRPPSKLIASNSNPNLRSLGQAHSGVAASESGNNRGSLPAFARNLPSDPYYGASIVNPTYRESIAFNKNSAAMSSNANLTVPQASGAATAHPLHPAGLVGVIAGEERARAARRGSPNAQGGYDLPPAIQPPQPMQRASMYGNYGGAAMSTPDLLSPGDQAQLQMSQQMTQMMQMQMQWMQHMMQMSGSPQQGQPPMPFPPGMPMMPNMALNTPPVGRPQSVPLQNYLDPAVRQQRTMSTLTPSMANWNNSAPAVPQLGYPMNGQYAPSIAPSERSNIGMASRYRPVSTIQPEPEPSWQRRASTFTSSTFRPLSQFGAGLKPSNPTIRTVQPTQDDEDDEQGWAEMKAKKEKKQRSWKLRKGNTLKELYNTPG